MKLIVVAPLWLPIPSPKYGGIERVVSNLVDGLVDRGHEVTLFAPGTTKTKAQRLEAVYPRPLREDNIDWNDVNYNLLASNRAIQLARDEQYDGICFSVERPYYLAVASLATVPTLFTLHGIWTYETQPKTEVDMLYAFKDQNFVSISLAQQSDMPDLHYSANVYNGLRIADHTYHAESQGYAVWMGRLEAEKGAHIAIEVAKQAGLKLKLAGPKRLELEAGRKYYEEQIAPHLGPDVEWVGEVSDHEKSDLLGNAAVMINPYQYHEAFGYATLEALACGTPVIVPTWGAGPEIIEQGVSGFTGRNIDEWVAATKQALTLDRAACRTRAETFDVSRMVEGYEKALTDLIASSKKA